MVFTVKIKMFALWQILSSYWQFPRLRLDQVNYYLFTVCILWARACLALGSSMQSSCFLLASIAVFLWSESCDWNGKYIVFEISAAFMSNSWTSMIYFNGLSVLDQGEYVFSPSVAHAVASPVLSYKILDSPSSYRCKVELKVYLMLARVNFYWSHMHFYYVNRLLKPKVIITC